MLESQYWVFTDTFFQYFTLTLNPTLTLESPYPEISSCVLVRNVQESQYWVLTNTTFQSFTLTINPLAWPKDHTLTPGYPYPDPSFSLPWDFQPCIGPQRTRVPVLSTHWYNFSVFYLDPKPPTLTLVFSYPQISTMYNSPSTELSLIQLFCLSWPIPIPWTLKPLLWPQFSLHWPKHPHTLTAGFLYPEISCGVLVRNVQESQYWAFTNTTLLSFLELIHIPWLIA